MVQRIADRLRSGPVETLLWTVRVTWGAAPADALLNLGANLALGLAGGYTVLVTGQLVDALNDGEAFLRLLLFLAGTLAVSELAGAVDPVTRNNAAEKTAQAVQEQVLLHTGTLSMAQLDEPATYDALDRAMSNNGARLVTTVFHLPIAVRMIVQGLGALAVVAVVSPIVAAVACLIVVPVGWAGARHGRRLFQLWRMQTHDSRLVHYLAGLLSSRPAATELRAYQLLPALLERWRQVFGRLQGQMMGAGLQGMREGWLADVAATALYAGALIVFVALSHSGAMTAGEIVAAAAALRLLKDSASGVATSVGLVAEHMLPVLELRRFLETRGRERPPEQGKEFRPGPICFEHVSFTYPGRSACSLHNVSLTINPGEKIALVGSNGAGKTTLIKLLLGLYQPTAGRITIAGEGLSEIAPGALRENVSCIFQDFARFDMTVADNVAMGRPGASRAEVEEACRLAGAAGVAGALPSGYDTVLGKAFAGGQEISGGQWQRLALARAFVRNAGIIVLDEPTAALDARAELDLFRRFVELVDGRTALLISHRLGAARLADRIIVMDGGQIAEEGSHSELLAAGGLYAEMFRAQAQWYAEEREVAV